MKVLIRLFCVLAVVCPTYSFSGTINGHDTGDQLAPEVAACWVSWTPSGVPITHVPESNSSADGTVWLNSVGLSPSTTVKYTFKFLRPGTPVKKTVMQFSNVSGGITTPFAFPFWGGNPHHGSALFVVKDASNKCAYPLTVGGSAFESADTKPIVDFATTDSFVNVSGIDGVIQKVSVSISLDHAFDGDLDIFLISPGGFFAELTSDNGGAGDDYGASSFSRTIFDDEAIDSIITGLAPFSGVFTPETPLSIFNGFSGSQVNGTWTLRVIDDAANDVGYIRGWSMVIKD